MTEQEAKLIATAESYFDEGEFEAARHILKPLIKRGVGAAIRLDCSNSDVGTSEEEIDRIYVDGMFRAADCGDLEAFYTVGIFYDMGGYEAVPEDKRKASEIFKEAAGRGHAHCMWIHATGLLWGQGPYELSVEEGLIYLEKAIEAGSASACITKARFLINGEFGFKQDLGQANRLRRLAKELDEIVYDPFGEIS